VRSGPYRGRGPLVARSLACVRSSDPTGDRRSVRAPAWLLARCSVVKEPGSRWRSFAPPAGPRSIGTATSERHPPDPAGRRSRQSGMARPATQLRCRLHRPRLKRGSRSGRTGASRPAPPVPRALPLINISEPTRQAEISYAAFSLKKKNIPKQRTIGLCYSPTLQNQCQ